MPILADILCKDMIKIGNYNELEVVKKVDFGFYLDGEEYRRNPDASKICS